VTEKTLTETVTSLKRYNNFAHRFMQLLEKIGLLVSGKAFYV